EQGDEVGTVDFGAPVGGAEKSVAGQAFIGVDRQQAQRTGAAREGDVRSVGDAWQSVPREHRESDIDDFHPSPVGSALVHRQKSPMALLPTSGASPPAKSVVLCRLLIAIPGRPRVLTGLRRSVLG